MHDYAQNSKQLFWSRKMIEIFIDLYKDNGCLYDKSHQDFNNNTVKASVLDNMLRKMREFLPTLELVDIQEKIKVIRAQFCEEIAFADAAGADYVPKLWCFDKLKFLREHITCWPTDSDSNDENTIQEEFQSENNDDDNDDDHVYLKTKLEQFQYAPGYRWDPVVTKIFIRTLEGYRVLFDPKYNDYKHRISRRKALSKLHKEMAEVDPQINIKHVYDKIISLRSCYLKELTRLRKKHGNNEKLKSKWWCFEMLGNLFKDRYLTQSNSKLGEEFEENDTYIEDSAINAIQEVEETANDDHYSNNEILEFEEIQQDFDADQETVFIMETLENNENPQNNMEYECVSTSMDYDTKIINIQVPPPTTTNSINQESCDNNETVIKVATNISAIEKSSPKARNKKKSIKIRTDLKYESLGDLVVKKLKDISPKYHRDFAWDIQCLVRKYILKSKADQDGNLSESITASNNREDISISRDIVLSRSPNISFNVSFV